MLGGLLGGKGDSSNYSGGSYGSYDGGYIGFRRLLIFLLVIATIFVFAGVGW